MGKQKSNKTKLFFRDCFKQRDLILLVIPGVVLVFIFSYIPMYGVLIAFQEYSPKRGIMGGEWVGFKYFIQFFENPYLFRLVRNTFLLGLYSLLWSFPAPIILALLLDQLPSQRFKKTVQSLTYFPYFISTVVIIGLVKEFAGIDGIFNQIREFFGGEAVSFLTGSEYFRTLFIGSGIWQGIGWGTIIYLAALSNVDPELHEAAKIDGANRGQIVLNITWPAIIPTVSIMLIFAVSGLFSTDVQKVMLLYSESIYETSDVIGTYVYREGILGGRFEYATAVGLLNSLIALVLMTGGNWFSRKLTGNSFW